MSYSNAAAFLRRKAPTQTHECRREFQRAADALDHGLRGSHDWARMLLDRDDVQGRKALERMIEFYEQNDGKADDFGRLFIVTDAQTALDERRA